MALIICFLAARSPRSTRLASATSSAALSSRWRPISARKSSSPLVFRAEASRELLLRRHFSGRCSGLTRAKAADRLTVGEEGAWRRSRWLRVPTGRARSSSSWEEGRHSTCSQRACTSGGSHNARGRSGTRIALAAGSSFDQHLDRGRSPDQQVRVQTRMPAESPLCLTPSGSPSARSSYWRFRARLGAGRLPPSARSVSASA